MKHFALHAALVVFAGLVIELATALAQQPNPSRDDGLRPGLLAIIADSRHSVTAIHPRPTLYLRAGESPHGGIDPDFTIEWRGLLIITQPGRYVFDVQGAVMSIDGRLIDSTPIELTGGAHEFLLKYERLADIAALSPRWQSDTFAWEPMPPRVFRYRPIEGVRAIDRQAERGRFLVEELGCVHCHDAGDAPFHRRARLDLAGVTMRVRSVWLRRWIENPRQSKPHTAMPDLPMRRTGDPSAIVQYLTELASRHDGNMARSSDEQADLALGEELYRSRGCAACHDLEGMQLDRIAEKWRPAALRAYLLDPHAITGTDRMPGLNLTGQESAHLAAYLLEGEAASALSTPISDTPKANGTKGRDALARLGCAACHRIDTDEPIENKLIGRALRDIDGYRGCLADQPADTVPHFNLTDEDREAIRLFIRRFQTRGLAHGPIAGLYRDVRRYGCIHCHDIDHLPRTIGDAEAAPTLTGAGDKLRRPWIEHVITTGARTRSHLHLRMPAYPAPVAARFARQLAQASGRAPDAADEDSPQVTASQQERGIALLGNDASAGGLGCIGCHDWGEYRAIGEGGPQLVGLADRVRFEWFGRWMRQPNRIRPGTSMPLFFTQTAPDATTATITDIWGALSMGEDAPTPAGAGIAPFVLGSEDAPLPLRSPIVLRTYMPRATPAAFAVGMPPAAQTIAPVSYCFDAGTCELRYAWSGGFIDMRPTMAKSMDPPVLLGEVFWEGAPSSWRRDGHDQPPTMRFRGYRLVEGYPEFHYEVDGATVFERIAPATDRVGLVRHFRVLNVSRALVFSPSAGAGDVSIEATPPVDESGALLLAPSDRVRFEIRILSEEGY